MRRMALTFGVVLITLCGAGLAFGQSLEEPEQLAMSDTLQYSLENNPTNRVANWVNPDTGHSGSVVPLKTYTNELGQPCREFITTIIIGGKEEQGYGTACRQPDGSWQIVAEDGGTTGSPAGPTNVYVYTPPERYYYVYPDAYYYYPSSFYYPYNIYLSFSYVFRSGHIHYGFYYLDGPAFRYRHPVHVRSRIYLGTRFFRHHHWYYRPPVHYRNRAPAPAHRQYYNRYDYRSHEVTRPDYRYRRNDRQTIERRDPDRYRQQMRRPPDRQQEERNRQLYRQPTQRRDRDGTRQQFRQPTDQRGQDRNRGQIQRPSMQRGQDLGPPPRGEMRAERQRPQTYQRSPYVKQERSRQAVEQKSGDPRQRPSHFTGDRFDGRRPGR